MYTLMLKASYCAVGIQFCFGQAKLSTHRGADKVTLATH